MPVYTKAQLYEDMGDKAINFAMYCTTDDVEAKAIKFMFESVSDVDYNSQVIKNLVLLLVSKGVFDAGVLQRIANRLNAESYP